MFTPTPLSQKKNRKKVTLAVNFVNCKHFSLIFIMKTQVKQHSRKYINKKQSLIIKKKHVYIGLT